MVIGRMARHYTGRTGIVIGVVIGRKGKGLWLHVSDDNGTWCQYARCK